VQGGQQIQLLPCLVCSKEHYHNMIGDKMSSTSLNVHVEDGQDFNLHRSDREQLVIDLSSYPSTATVFITDAEFDRLVLAVNAFRESNGWNKYAPAFTENEGAK
jgi:hypothetical protein